MSAAPAAVCILNGAANSQAAQTRRAELEALLVSHAVDIVEPGPDDDCMRLARRAIERGARLVIAAGGDGTVSAVAGAVAGTQSTLGVLPLGTLNHFARDMGIPLALDEAVAAVFSGHERLVDVGEVNGRVFVNNSSLGLYPGMVVNREALERQGHGRWSAFVQAVGFVLRTYSRLTLEMTLDGTVQRTTTPFIFVGNNRYHVTAPRIGERDSLGQGCLWICQAPHATRIGLVLLALQALLGMRNRAEIIERAAAGLEIRARHRLRVATDGEVTAMASPLRYRCRPKALRVMVPAAAGI